MGMLIVMAMLLGTSSVRPVKADSRPFRVYLTFDDGPSERTAAILDTLKQYNVKATFFIQGASIAGHEAVLRREVQEGQHIGSHLWNHSSPTLAQSRPSDSLLIERFNETQTIIAAALGTDLWQQVVATEPIMPFRWPGGALRPFPREDVITYNWNASAGDDTGLLMLPYIEMQNALYGNPARKLYGAYDWGDGTIILMHDTKISTVHALPRIIEDLQNHGATFGVLHRPEDAPGSMPIHLGEIPPCAHVVNNCTDLNARMRAQS